MNDHGIDFQEETQQNHGLISDFYSGFKNCSSKTFEPQQNWDMGTCVHLQTMDGESEQKNFESQKSNSTIMNLFETPASAFFATERYMGFPQVEFQDGNSSHFDKTCDSFNFSMDSAELSDTDSEFRNTLQSVVKSQLCKRSHNGFPKINFHDHKMFDDCTVPIGKHCFAPFKGFPEQTVCYNTNSYSVSQPNFSSPQEKLSPRFCFGGVSVGSGSGSSSCSGNVLSSKTRIRWTQDLHEKFVDCVNCLGGAEKATPKAILKLMDSEGLTIFHVKSHLQKYRVAKYMPDSVEGKSDKTTGMNEVPPLDVKTGLQIREALQLQLDVQRRLHEQLEIQRKLQLQIEEQGRQLKMMFDQQQETNKCFFRTNDFNKPTPHNPTSNVDDDPPILTDESFRNSQFPSKIS